MYQVLIVDDEPILKIAMRSIIPWEEHGFTICGAASNGEEALQLVHDCHPDLVFTDLKMPKMDGLELIRALKAENFPGEILVLSNYEDFDSVREALLLGASDYLLKLKISAELIQNALEKVSAKLQEKTLQQSPSSNTSLLRQERLEEFFVSKLPAGDFFADDPTGTFAFTAKSCAVLYLSLENQFLADSSAFSESQLRSTLMDALQGIAHPFVFAPSRYDRVIVLGEDDITAAGIHVSLLANKIVSRFTLYHSFDPLVLYHDRLPDWDEARSEYHRMSDIVLLRFYSLSGEADASQIHLMHYIEGEQYKEMARAIYKNGAAQMDASLAMVEALAKRCETDHVYPEILQLFLIKLLDFLEYMTGSVSVDQHDYLMEIKESMRISPNVSELLQNLTSGMHVLFGIGTDAASAAAYKSEVQAAIDYMQHNYQHRITLATIASQVGLSSSYLCKIFKAETGQSITAYLTDLRMAKACELLQGGQYSIKEVAISIGIDDQLYFSRMFRKQYGVAPSEYKKN